MNRASAQQDDDARLRQLVAVCVDRFEAEGERVIGELCAAEPRYEAALRRRMATLRQLGLLARPQPFAGYPDRLGDFRLLGRRGEGGMGVVFEAEQISLKRRVALKVLRAEHLFMPQARDRFRREVDALANLNSPGIVPVFAVGEDAGLPYFAMELIDGRNVSEVLAAVTGRSPATLDAGDMLAALPAARSGSAADPRPTTRTDDGLFAGTWIQACCRVALRVARTLAEAHERGVLHRDVKPSNVMLERGGRVLLLDFGLARPVDPASAITRSGSVLGSLPYMAPEQLRGDAAAIGPATDVYGVGVTLYEMLTGSRPYDGANEGELRAAIEAGVPPSPRSRNPSLDRDAETICLKAMDADPARRYASATELADDLARFLDLRPVAARRAGAAHRVRRWAQRHPGRAASLLALLAAVILGPSALAVQQHFAAQRISAALATARRYQQQYETTLAEAVRAIEATALRAAGDPELAETGLDAVREQLLQDSVASLERLHHLDTDSPALRQTLASSRVTLAQLHRALGDPRRADAELQEAVALLEKLAAEHGGAGDALARALVVLGNGNATDGRHRDALRHWQRALAIMAALPQPADDPEPLGRRLAIDARIAAAQAELGQTDEARAGMERVVATMAELAEDHPSRAAIYELDGARLKLANVLHHADDLEGAAAAYRRAIAAIEQRRQAAAARPSDLSRLANGYLNLAQVLARQGDDAGCVDALEHGVAIHREAVAAFPLRVSHRLELAHALARLAEQPQSAPTAPELFGESLRIADAVVAAHPDHLEARMKRAMVSGMFAQTLARGPAPDLERAEELVAGSVADYAAAVAARAQDPDLLAHLATSQTIEGNIRADRGNLDAAVAALEGAIGTWEKALAARPGSRMVADQFARALASYAAVLDEAGRGPEAAPHLERAFLELGLPTEFLDHVTAILGPERVAALRGRLTR